MCKSEMEHTELSKTKPVSNLQLTFWKIFDNLTTIPGQDIPFPMLLEIRFCKQRGGSQYSIQQQRATLTNSIPLNKKKQH